MTITLLAPDGVAITAQQMRQASAALYGGGANRPLGGRSGFRADTASTVFSATSTTWTLNPCSAMIDPGASTYQGMYGWATDAVITGSVTAANATNPRKDIVYIQINDSSAGDGSGALNANVLYLAGTPAASPVPPALPARSFLVGTITVPQSGGGSPTVVMNPARFVAAGGILPVYSQAERDALVAYDGLAVRRMDLTTRQIETYNGSAWLQDGRDGLPYKTASGTGTLAIGAANTSVSSTVNFPAGAFTQVPVVQVTFASNAARASMISAYSTTTSSFTIKMQTCDGATYGSSFTLAFNWVAVQQAP
jgi:hypothetical protein